MYQIEFSPKARREFKKLPSGVQILIKTHIDQLAKNPHQGRKLEGNRKEWRIRIGHYRVIYEIIQKKIVVYILKVGHRREVYRR